MPKISSKNKVKLKKLDNQYYLEKDNIIIDKTCPGCGKFIIEEKDFCVCGCYLKGKRIFRLWGTFLLLYVIMGILVLTGLANITKARTFFSKEGKKSEWSIDSLAPVNIQLIGSLKDTSYDGYIQSIYVKPHQENKLQILIKPSLWNTLSKNEKNDLFKQLNTRWTDIYKHNNPDSKEKPIVGFANN
jgi:hypothetical protein